MSSKTSANLVLVCAALMACNGEERGVPDSRGVEPQPDTIGSDPHEPQERAWWELGMGDPFLDELVLYYLGGASYGGTEVAEVLETASRIRDSEPATWAREWKHTAERLLDVAETSDARGLRISAGHAYFRSSTYLRAALHYYPDPHDPEVETLARAAVARFSMFLERVHPETASILQIPYEGTTLIGYWFRGARPGEKAPTIIACPHRPS